MTSQRRRVQIDHPAASGTVIAHHARHAIRRDARVGKLTELGVGHFNLPSKVLADSGRLPNKPGRRRETAAAPTRKRELQRGPVFALRPGLDTKPVHSETNTPTSAVAGSVFRV